MNAQRPETSSSPLPPNSNFSNSSKPPSFFSEFTTWESASHYLHNPEESNHHRSLYHAQEYVKNHDAFGSQWMGGDGEENGNGFSGPEAESEASSDLLFSPDAGRPLSSAQMLSPQSPTKEKYVVADSLNSTVTLMFEMQGVDEQSYWVKETTGFDSAHMD
ncbi:hypothetical protein IFR05_003689 [Cadophora sp. M221]|nr:hypothetical protein IFR05_003689 [Cadophora sp. M221]